MSGDQQLVQSQVDRLSFFSLFVSGNKLYVTTYRAKREERREKREERRENSVTR
jgi:hypothetical protein